jgi:agmatinase
MSFPFLHAAGFAQLPNATAAHPFAIAGVAWDGATTNRPGARFGPAAIRQASHMLCDGHHPVFDVVPAGHCGDAGDLPLPNTALPALRTALEALALPLIQRHHMAWLGGDHSITLSLLRAYRQHLGRPLAVLHFDAHCDTWTDHFGEPSGHGTWVSEAIEEGMIDPRGMFQIGIRSPAARATREYVADRGGFVWGARQLRGLESAAQWSPVLSAVRERMQALGQPPIYLTLDIDCLDPAFAPGTGTPEPGGLSSSQLLTVLESLVDLPFVGMDCVEVSPPYDHAQLTSLAAAYAVWTYLCGRIAAKNGIAPT